MANPFRVVIAVDVLAHLRSSPPWDQEIDESLIEPLAHELCQRFDAASLYDQIDQLACTLLRERGLGPEQTSEQP
jgi:hypothetical protein